MTTIGRLFILVLICSISGCSGANFGSGLLSNPNIGLSPKVHHFGDADVRTFTRAPLGAEVKVFLPIPPEEAMAIVYKVEDYPSWVTPPPTKIAIDNSNTPDGKFGVGTRISYEEGQTDIIEHLNKGAAMIVRPLWATSDLKEHRGVVFVQPYKGGSLMHMRRYFEVATVKGFAMSTAMPGYMKASAENLAKRYNGKVL